VPSLRDHQSNAFTKLLIEGDSGSGKTGCLASLVKVGYKLRILDFDNGLEPLKQYILKECPDKLDNVEFRTFRDKRKASATGPVIDGQPTAFIKAIQMLDRWKYDDVDLGVPADWGPECICVIDSLTFMSDAAYDWREPLAAKGKSGEVDKRAIYGDAQNAIESVLALLTSESFRTNVIVISHIRYMENPDGTKKGYPTAVGSALGPIIPRYFNSVALCQTQGGRRTIQTTATAMIDLKNPAPFAMLPNYPLDTGLAQFFAVLREPPKVTNGTTPSPRLHVPTPGQGGSGQREQAHGGVVLANARRVQAGS